MAENTDSLQINNYGSLLTRFKNNELLTPEEYSAVYYGFIDHENYTGSMVPGIFEINDAMKKGDYAKAYQTGIESLEKYPVSLDLLMKTGRAAINLEYPKEDYAPLLYKCFNLMKAISAGGDGLSADTAYRVLSVSDEYTFMMDFLGIRTIKSQGIGYNAERSYDVFDVGQGKSYDGETIYFDITPSLSYME